MDFVESIRSEGVILERKKMGPDTPQSGPVVIEVDYDNPQKNVEDLDIEIPILTQGFKGSTKTSQNLTYLASSTKRLSLLSSQMKKA